MLWQLANGGSWGRSQAGTHCNNGRLEAGQDDGCHGSSGHKSNTLQATGISKQP